MKLECLLYTESFIKKNNLKWNDLKLKKII